MKVTEDYDSFTIVGPFDSKSDAHKWAQKAAKAVEKGGLSDIFHDYKDLIFESPEEAMQTIQEFSVEME